MEEKDILMVQETLFEIVELIKQPKGKKHAIIALPDAGLVGTIAGMHIVQELHLELAGYIDTEIMPPVAVIHHRKARPPIQIYANADLLLIVSEIPLPAEAMRPVSIAILKYLQELEPKSIVALGGSAVPPALRTQVETPEVFAVTTTPDEYERVNKQKIKFLDEGIVAGTYAIILLEAERQKIPVTYVMAQSFLNIPDPGAAAETIKTLSQLTGISIPTNKLIEGAEEVRVRVRDLMNQTTTSMQTTGKDQEFQIPAFYS
ncbi:MAG: proteasome assembly chaperone family protein [Candidatus Hodarchaeota archaeon]